MRQASSGSLCFGVDSGQNEVHVWAWYLVAEINTIQWMPSTAFRCVKFLAIQRSCQSQTMAALQLDLDEDVQLDVLVPNMLVGASTVDLGAETATNTLLRLQAMHNMRLTCKAWKAVVDKSTEYNALRLAEYDCAMWPNDLNTRFMTREFNIVTQFQENMKWFSKSRHVTTRVSRRTLRARLEDLTLSELDGLREALEMSFYAVEFYGMTFHSSAPYWICPSDRV